MTRKLFSRVCVCVCGGGGIQGGREGFREGGKRAMRIILLTYNQSLRICTWSVWPFC